MLNQQGQLVSFVYLWSYLLHIHVTHNSFMTSETSFFIIIYHWFRMEILLITYSLFKSLMNGAVCHAWSDYSTTDQLSVNMRMHPLGHVNILWIFLKDGAPSLKPKSSSLLFFNREPYAWGLEVLTLIPAASRLTTDLRRQSALRLQVLKIVFSPASPQPRQINNRNLWNETQTLNAVYAITKYRRAWLQGLLVSEQHSK